MCLIISTTNVVLLIFIWWWRFLDYYYFSSILISTFDFLLGLSGSWVFSFPVMKFSDNFFFLSLQRIQSLSGDIVVILAPCTEILEKLGVSLVNLSFLNFISFSFSFLVSLSYKLVYEIDLVLFSVFTVSYV